MINITGQIVKRTEGYFIRGKKPGEAFRILNPDPKILDALVKSCRMVKIDADSIVGDNVDIEKIDGRTYKQGKAK